MHLYCILTLLLHENHVGESELMLNGNGFQLSHPASPEQYRRFVGWVSGSSSQQIVSFQALIPFGPPRANSFFGVLEFSTREVNG